MILLQNLHKCLSGYTIEPLFSIPKYSGLKLLLKDMKTGSTTILLEIKLALSNWPFTPPFIYLNKT